MQQTKLRHSLALGAFVAFGATGTFVAGAKAGAALNHHLASTSVARIPLRELQERPITLPPPPPAPIARK